jgi:hypothetical protein
MTKIILERMFAKITEGRIKDTDAVLLLLEGIYLYPLFFGYADLDEDARSTFLLSIYPRLQRMLESYQSGLSSFLTYVSNSVKLYAKSWRRKVAKEQASRDSISYCFQSEIGFDQGLITAESEPEYMKESALPSINLPEQNYIDMLLVLALKCAASLSEYQISAIADATGLPVSRYIFNINERLGKKSTERQYLVETRNQAWFLKARYRLELERIRPDTAQYEIVVKKYRYQSQALKMKNMQLNEKFQLEPSNTYIGELLKMDQRKVTKLLDQAKGGALMEIINKSKQQGENEY